MSMTTRLAARYTAMYLAVYLVGLAAVMVAVWAGMPRQWSGGVVLITAPLTFVGGRLVMALDRSALAVQHGLRCSASRVRRSRNRPEGGRRWPIQSRPTSPGLSAGPAAETTILERTRTPLTRSLSHPQGLTKTG